MNGPPTGADRVILWDFDGTLGHRPGMWRGCLVEVLDEHEPGHGVEPEDLLPFLREGFPWDRAEVAHPELSDPDAWWAALQSLLATAYEGARIETERARELAAHVRARYVDPSHSWTLYADTIPVLDALRARGWRHLILSNHVPELPAIVAGLGLAPLLDAVLTSAAIGVEKPNPAAFELALERAGRPETVWMVGDNPVADVAGAEAVGIPAILVRTDDGAAVRRAGGLAEVAAIVG